ncbi:MAG TPA: sigma-70 family RNA polymerase sigma factor [Acidobacteriota bacterium]|nr:sigma-70 family RNA polymerase sigma factor [Acidobacteriota bacterium]
MDKESENWLEALRSEPPLRDEALARLHTLLLRVARSEAGRRRGKLPPQTVAELEDLCMQAANDALEAVTRKLDSFRGLSRFTTWASKFVVLEISSRLRSHAWRDRRIDLSATTWEQLASSCLAADSALEQQERSKLLREAMAQNLTDRQRMILTAVVMEEVPIDVLAERLGSSRGGLYKVLHDARSKLREALTEDHRAGGLL